MTMILERQIKSTTALLIIIFFTAAAFAADGDLDTGFNGDGKVSTDLRTTNDIAWEVLAQPDGKAVLIGSDNSSRVSPVRYNVNGSLDTTFGASGDKVVASAFVE